MYGFFFFFVVLDNIIFSRIDTGAVGRRRYTENKKFLNRIYLYDENVGEYY